MSFNWAGPVPLNEMEPWLLAGITLNVGDQLRMQPWKTHSKNKPKTTFATKAFTMVFLKRIIFFLFFK